MEFSKVLFGITLLSGLLLPFSASAENEECMRVESQIIYASYRLNISENEDAGKVYNDVVLEFLTIADKLKLENFKFENRDISGYKAVDPSAPADKRLYEVNISVSASFLKDDRAFDTFLKKTTGAEAVSSSISEVCL